MTREISRTHTRKTHELEIGKRVENIIEDVVWSLQKVRNEKKISQYKLAQMTGLAHTTIMRIENFSTTPSLEAVLRIAIALNVDWTQLQFDENTCVNNSELQFSSLESGISQKDTDETLLISDTCCREEQNEDIQNIELHTLQSNPTSFYEIAQTIRPYWKTEIAADQYIEGVERALISYISCIAQYALGQIVSSRVKQLSNSLVLVLREYYMGQHTSAYKLFAETMSQIDISSLYSTLQPGKMLYRARRKEKNKHLAASDFLHIPLEKRIKVSSQRYSFPGLPCLYIGTSRDVCIRELGCNFDSVAVAQLQINDTEQYRLLDLTEIFKHPIKAMNLENQRNFIELLPLVYLCSTEIKLYNDFFDSNDSSTTKREKFQVPFRPDYVIPQLLLEYILDKTICENTPIVGIQYFSVQDDFYSKWLAGEMEELEKTKNIVIPVQTYGNFGYCKTLEKMVHVIYDDKVK